MVFQEMGYGLISLDGGGLNCLRSLNWRGRMTVFGRLFQERDFEGLRLGD